MIFFKLFYLQRLQSCCHYDFISNLSILHYNLLKITENFNKCFDYSVQILNLNVKFDISMINRDVKMSDKNLDKRQICGE